MCATCGCDSDGSVKVVLMGDDQKLVDDPHLKTLHDHHHHHHSHHQHDHHHHERSAKIDLERDVLYKNDMIAQRIRGFLEAKNIVAINLVSAPGSGKTTLLEKTIELLKGNFDVAVIEGDQQTTHDAERIQSTGVPVVQVNTGNGCHLDAEMINQAIKKLHLKDNSVLLIENVGNLVCPSLFDLGENKRVVIVSVTEGEDKPLKYPNMFATSDLCIINKTDLLPYVDFDIAKTREYALRINHHLEFIETSATRDEGIIEWVTWIKKQLAVPA